MKNKIVKPGLYVHLPFCVELCPYCGFSKLFYQEQIVNQYIQKLKEELIKYSSFVFDSIYIGGGTPTSLSYSQLKEVFEILKKVQHENTFLTIEMNPDISLDLLTLFNEYGVKRVSIGVQTFQKRIQEQIHRYTTKEQIQHLINKLHEVGIYNINVDLMYGFDHQTIEELDEDLKDFMSLDIQHISTYCLQIEEGTMFYLKKYQATSDETEASFYHHIVQVLAQNGFYRYEVSNFAKPGYESKHNLIYWHNQEYGAIGLSASSYIDKVRKTNTKSITKYLNGIYEDYVEPVSIEDEEFYFIMLGLRLEKGIRLQTFKELFHEDFIEKYKEKIDPLFEQNLLIKKDDSIAVHPDKFFILDFILRKILY